MRVAIVSTFPPRRCGIGTFAADVRDALVDVHGVDGVETVVIDNERSTRREDRPSATIEQAVRGDYVRAAGVLDRLEVDVVLLQHEYGIFGGRDGEYVLSLAQEVSQPFVATLHTVLSEPTRHQARVLTELCDRARLVIVMTETARRLLVDGGMCADEKVRVVPHGAPVVLGERARERFASLGRYAELRDRFLLTTFGLISAGKGIELMIQALPELVEQHPQVSYMIAGRTHPEVVRREGERYRSSLEHAVVELGLDDHVIFADRFIDVDELADLLAATSVLVTPYRKREQIASGSLTFGIAAGCAAVSTPYWYAQDMLASGAGQLVPFDDPDALRAAVCRYIEEPELLASARAEASRIGETLAWPSVGELTAAVLAEAVEAVPRRRRISVTDWHYDRARLDHLLTLVDDVGIIQHADGVIPNRHSGYCTDDVARLAPVALELARRSDPQVWSSIVYRSLAFLTDATEPSGMHNFMRYDRRWDDEPHVGDHVGRSIWALGEILDTASTAGLVGPARRLLDRLVDVLPPDASLRTAAYAVLGLGRLHPEGLEERAQALLEQLVERLADAYERTAAEDWRWFEDVLTYDNARLPHALLVGGAALGRDDVTDVGLTSLRWLGDESGLREGRLRLTGNRWRRRGEPAPGEGDEQALDACAFVEAELAAFELTSDREHCARAQLAFGWFLGRNRLRRPVYDFATGGCGDGLGDAEHNGNEGAESTLAFHRAALVLDAAGLPTVVYARDAALAG